MTKNLVASTKNLVTLTKNFGSTNQKFSCRNPHHFLVGLTINEGLPDQNLRLTQPNWCLDAPTLTKGWTRLQNYYECEDNQSCLKLIDHNNVNHQT